VAKLGTHSGVFYAEFAIVENLLKLRELISDLPNLDPQLALFSDWGSVLCSLFNPGTELIRMKHQFGECFGVFGHWSRMSQEAAWFQVESGT
jgi:hypothetical protein